MAEFSLLSTFRYRKGLAELLERHFLSVRWVTGWSLLFPLLYLCLRGGKYLDADTEGSFMIERVAQMAKSLVAYLRRKAKVLSVVQTTLLPQTFCRHWFLQEINNLDLMLEAEQLTFEKILSRIHYNRVYNYTEQLAVIDQLDNFLTKHPNVIIDCICPLEGRLIILRTPQTRSKWSWLILSASYSGSILLTQPCDHVNLSPSTKSCRLLHVAIWLR